MFIKRNKQKEEEIIEKFRQVLKKRGEARPEGIHVSDLCLPLKGYWNRFNPHEPSRAAVGYFISGQVLEDIIANHAYTEDYQYLSGWDREDLSISHTNGEWEGIHYEIDIMDDEEPTEFKSARTRNRYKNVQKGHECVLIDELDSAGYEDLFEHYIKQHRKYCVIKGINTGYIVVFFLALATEKKNKWQGRATPEIRVYRVGYLPKEIEKEKENMLKIRDLLLDAIKREDPSKLTKCPFWLCGDCPHYKTVCEGNISYPPKTEEPKKKRGRPKGSKNKKKEEEQISSLLAAEQVAKTKRKLKRNLGTYG